MEHRLLEGDVLDHVAAALPGRHGFEDARAAIDDADAGRREHLVAGEDEEVGVQRLHVDRHVRDRLRPVDERDGAVTMGHGDHLRDRRDGAQRVRHLADRGDARPRREQLLVFLEDDLPGVVHGRDPQLAPFSAASCCQGTMLAWCSRCVMTISSPSLTLRPPQPWREVDALGRAAHKDDLSGDGALMKARTLRARPRRRRWRARPACARRGGCSSSRARRSRRGDRSRTAASASWRRCRATQRAPVDVLLRGSGSRA